MADPLGSIFSSCEDEIFPLDNPPEPCFLHPTFAAAADTISTHSTPESPSSSSDSASSPYEEFQTPPEDSRRSIPEESDLLYSPGGGIEAVAANGGGLDEETVELLSDGKDTDLDSISVGENRMPENRSPIGEVSPPSKKVRVSEGGSGAIEDDDDDHDHEIDTEVIEECDDEDDDEEVYCHNCADNEGNGNKEDGGETNAGEMGMLLEVLALLAREEWEERQENEVVDLLETANCRGITFPGLNGDEELH